MYCNRNLNGIVQNLYYHTAKLNVIYLLRFFTIRNIFRYFYEI